MQEVIQINLKKQSVGQLFLVDSYARFKLANQLAFADLHNQTILSPHGIGF